VGWGSQTKELLKPAQPTSSAPKKGIRILILEGCEITDAACQVCS